MHFSENSGTNSSSNVTEIFVADFFSLVFFNIFYSHIGNRKIAFNIGFASWRTKTFPETSNVSTSIGIFNDGNIGQKCLVVTKDKIRSNFVYTFISIQDGSLTNFRKNISGMDLCCIISIKGCEILFHAKIPIIIKKTNHTLCREKCANSNLQNTFFYKSATSLSGNYRKF